MTALQDARALLETVAERVRVLGRRYISRKQSSAFASETLGHLARCSELLADADAEAWELHDANKVPPRPRKCSWRGCGGQMPKDCRRDAKFCSERCRLHAHRDRGREKDRQAWRDRWAARTELGATTAPEPLPRPRGQMRPKMWEHKCPKANGALYSFEVHPTTACPLCGALPYSQQPRLPFPEPTQSRLALALDAVTKHPENRELFGSPGSPRPPCDCVNVPRVRCPRHGVPNRTPAELARCTSDADISETLRWRGKVHPGACFVAWSERSGRSTEALTVPPVGAELLHHVRPGDDRATCGQRIIGDLVSCTRALERVTCPACLQLAGRSHATAARITVATPAHAIPWCATKPAASSTSLEQASVEPPTGRRRPPTPTTQKQTSTRKQHRP